MILNRVKFEGNYVTAIYRSVRANAGDATVNGNGTV